MEARFAAGYGVLVGLVCGLLGGYWIGYTDDQRPLRAEMERAQAEAQARVEEAGASERAALDELAETQRALRSLEAELVEARRPTTGLGVSRDRLVDVFERDGNGGFAFEAVRSDFWQGQAASEDALMHLRGEPADLDSAALLLFFGRDTTPEDARAALERYRTFMAVTVPDWPGAEAVSWLNENLSYATQNRDVSTVRHGRRVELSRVPDLGMVQIAVQKP